MVKIDYDVGDPVVALNDSEMFPIKKGHVYLCVALRETYTFPCEICGDATMEVVVAGMPEVPGWAECPCMFKKWGEPNREIERREWEKNPKTVDAELKEFAYFVLIQELRKVVSL